MFRYNKIYDFNTNRFVNVNSQRGGRILNNYLLRGGMLPELIGPAGVYGISSSFNPRPVVEAAAPQPAPAPVPASGPARPRRNMFLDCINEDCSHLGPNYVCGSGNVCVQLHTIPSRSQPQPPPPPPPESMAEIRGLPLVGPGLLTGSPYLERCNDVNRTIYGDWRQRAELCRAQKPKGRCTFYPSTKKGRCRQNHAPAYGVEWLLQQQDVTKGKAY